MRVRRCFVLLCSSPDDLSFAVLSVQKYDLKSNRVNNNIRVCSNRG